MFRLKLLSRIRRGARQYIANDAIAAAVVAFLTNQDPDQIAILQDASAEDRAGMDQFLKHLEEIEGIEGIPGLVASAETLRRYADSLFPTRRVLVVFCGPSSVGKDTIASKVKGKLILSGARVEWLDKYTTRKRRGAEGLLKGEDVEPSSNYTYLPDHESLVAHEDAVLRYSLYGFTYAFSNRHLASTDNGDRHLACIYGPLDQIEEFRQDVERKYLRAVFAILLTAPSRDLRSRLVKRHSLTVEEREARLKVLESQAEYIERHEQSLRKKYDLVRENGDRTAVEAVAECVTTAILKRFPWMREST